MGLHKLKNSVTGYTVMRLLSLLKIIKINKIYKSWLYRGTQTFSTDDMTI